MTQAAQVQDFYERYPYPRPLDSLDEYRRLWQDGLRRRADHHLFWPGRSFREDHRILIAGCGTSQAAKHALRWRGIGWDAVAALAGYRLTLEFAGLSRARGEQVSTSEPGSLHRRPEDGVELEGLVGSTAICRRRRGRAWRPR